MKTTNFLSIISLFVICTLISSCNGGNIAKDMANKISNAVVLQKDSKDEPISSQGKHCTYTVGCNCPGFSPITDGDVRHESICKRCRHHKSYHK